MTIKEEFAWKVYNFIEKWKNGDFGEVRLQTALDKNFILKEEEKLRDAMKVIEQTSLSLTDIATEIFDRCLKKPSFVKLLASKGASVRLLNCVKTCIEYNFDANDCSPTEFVDNVSEIDFLRVRNCGRLTLAELKEILAQEGYELRKNNREE